MRSGLWQQNLKLVLKKNYSKQHHDCPMSMGNKISVLWQLSTPGSLSGWLSHFGIMSTQWKAPLKFSQTQCTQNSASFMGPHNWSPIIPKVTSLSAGYQNNIGGFSTRAQAYFLKSGSTGRNICAFMKTFGKQAFFEHFHTQQRFKVRTHEQCSKVSFGPQGPKHAGVQNWLWNIARVYEPLGAQNANKRWASRVLWKLKINSCRCLIW